MPWKCKWISNSVEIVYIRDYEIMTRLWLAEEARLQLYGSHRRNISPQTARSTQFRDLGLKLHLVAVLPDPLALGPAAQKQHSAAGNLQAEPPRLVCGKVMAVPSASGAVGGLCFYVARTRGRHPGQRGPLPCMQCPWKRSLCGILLPASQPARCYIRSGLPLLQHPLRSGQRPQAGGTAGCRAWLHRRIISMFWKILMPEFRPSKQSCAEAFFSFHFYWWRNRLREDKSLVQGHRATVPNVGWPQSWGLNHVLCCFSTWPHILNLYGSPLLIINH